MQKFIAWPGPLARMEPASRHLTLALAASGLFHAVLLSLHFGLPRALSLATERALDVILVNSKSATRPKSPQALAQANLDGGGNTEDNHLAGTPLPVAEKTREGEDLVEARRRVSSMEIRQQQLLTQARLAKAVSPAPQPDAPAPTSGSDLANSAMDIARIEGQISRNTDNYNTRPRKMFVGASTEAYLPAQYIEDWRQKVERIGNLNYPQAAKGKLYGNLIIDIEISSNGELERAEIRRSSGHKILDDAALRIVRMAAPYGEFPAELKRQTDILSFARVWNFTRSDEFQTK